MGDLDGETRGLTRDRAWRFGAAMLDERRRILTVEGRAVHLEPKTLDLLRLLLARAGEVVTKDELIARLWPATPLAEPSLQTAVMKLRRALGDDGDGPRIIETIPRVGYRLAVPVVVDGHGDGAAPFDAPARPASPPPGNPWRRRALALVGVTVLCVGGATWMMRETPTPAQAAAPVTHAEAMAALRALDLPRVTSLLDRGWDPNAPLDKVGSTPLDIALEVCEWNPHHDRERLVQIVRALLDAQARLEVRNKFGDTAYSIAKAPRYCGPDHPATRLIRTMCYSGAKPLGDGCLASYEKR